MTKAANSSNGPWREAIDAARLLEGVVGNGWAADNVGRFTYATPGQLKLLGLTLDDINAGPGEDAFGWKQVIHPDDYIAAAEAWRRSLRTGEAYNVAHRMLRPDGAYRWSRCSGQPMRDGNGEITGWYGSVLHSDPKTSEDAFDPVGSPFDVKGLPLRDVHPDDRRASVDGVTHAFWTGIPRAIRLRLRQADGQFHWVQTTLEPPRYDPSGALLWHGPIIEAVTPTHGLGCVQHAAGSLTKAPETEEEARRTIAAVEGLFGNAWIIDPDGKITYLNPFSSGNIEESIEEVNAAVDAGGTAWKAHAHPDDYENLAAVWRHCLNTGEPFFYEHRVRLLGGYAWNRSVAKPIRDGHGQITAWYGISITTDLSKQNEMALRQRERELSQLVDLVPSHVWRLTPEGKPAFFNKRMTDYLGLNIADVNALGEGALEALVAKVHADDALKFKETLDHSLRTGEQFSMRYRLRRTDGVYRWMSGRAEPLRDEGGRILQWYGICHDIHDQVTAQEALRLREKELKRLVDAVPAMIWSATPAGTPTYVNTRLTTVVGITLADLLAEDGSRSLSHIHPDQRDDVERALTRSFETGSPFAMIYSQRRSDGSYRRTDVRAEALRDEAGAIVQWYGVCVDVEDLLRAQEELHERERFLWQLVETLPVMIDCAAPDGEPVYRSQKLREFLGYQLEELSGSNRSRLQQTLDASVHPADLTSVKNNYRYSLTTGTPYSHRHRLRRFDGEYRWVETRAAPMRNADDEIIQWNVICLDIDGEVRAQEDLRLAQERLARSTQAASLAELSASIAHEVNQPLAAVVANSHACQRWLKATPPNMDRAQVTIDRIIRDANAAADVVSRIRALFRQSVQPRLATSLEQLVAESVRLLADLITQARVSMNIRVAADLPPVLCDHVQVQQVLTNLARNAIEALDSRDADRQLIICAGARGDVVKVEVTDNGSGIAHPEKVFDAFFTTKESGMGMGLAISRSIIESHGGRLWVEAPEAGGTTFAFTLPVALGASQ